MNQVLSNGTESHVVLVGTARYRDRSLADLPAVKNNLEALHAAFTHGPWGLPSEHCTVLLDQDEPSAVLEVLADAAARATDTLIFYYAGHGLADTLGADNQLLLALTRAKAEDRPWRSLSYADVRRVLLDPTVLTKRKVVILDCCFSGLAGGLGEPDGLNNFADIRGSYVLTATSPTSMALSPPGELYTGFTGAFLSIYWDGIHGKEANLDMNTVYERLLQILPARGLPRPQQKNAELGGRITFVVNRAYRTDDTLQSVLKDRSAPVSVPMNDASATGGAPVRLDTSDHASGHLWPHTPLGPEPRPADESADESASGATSSSDSIPSGQTLATGRALLSRSGTYRLVYQWDGNLVLYQNQNNIPIWDWGTSGTSPGRCTMREDGSLVINDADGHEMRNTGTSGNPGSYLVIEDIGNVVIRHPSGKPLWDTQGLFQRGTAPLE
ncbi:caspase family protein [Streptomyces europaeiscabiei]|uniref:Caspase family protein n=1 Tax=Streptomyces europaeiscabiei TaxID=146819 RepID=A0AAJ2PTJ1_9ACTN|nr:caspase family protein [Streptomyces europaeiscabiei]MDX3132902.1 caspase family protein [Streptomyces europaeiscabiei]